MNDDERSSASRVPALDGLRGIAILLVLLFHFAPGGESLLSGGFLGVDLFFVLSGFLITTLLLEEKRRFGKLSLFRFYARRALRLLPALFFLLLSVAVYAHLRLPEDARAKVYRGIVSSLFYFSNWILSREQSALHMLNHTWSLSIEEQFYICFPLLLSLCFALHVGERLLALMLFLASVVSALLMAQYFSGPEAFYVPYERTDSHLSPILVGAFLAAFQFGRHTRANVWAGVAGTFGLSGFAWYADFRSAYMYQGGFFLFALTAALLVSYASGSSHSPLTRMLAIAPLRWLGKISYGIYLWHFPVFVAISVEFPGPQTLWHFVCGTAIALGIATCSFYVLEKPCLRLKQRFSSVHLETS